MKRIAFFMIALLMVGGLAMAQRPHRRGMKMDPKERAEKMTERMTKQYSLNADQQKQLMEINLAFNEKMAKGNEDKKLEREQMFKKMRKNRDAYNSQLKKVMTEDQYALYTKRQAERRHRMGGGRRP